MNIEQIKEIINPIVIFLTSGTGALLIGVVVKAIVAAVATVKSKKAAKLTEADKQDIANKLLQAMQGGLKVDMDAELDRATNKRMTAMEERLNEFSELMNKVINVSSATMSAVGDFKTISQESREKIKALSDDVSSARAAKFEVPATPTVELKVPAETSSTGVDKKPKY